MADRPRVFVARRLPDEGLDLVRSACEVDLWDGELPPPRDELLRRVAGVDGALTLLTDKVDDEFLDAAGPQLRVVSNYAVGFISASVFSLMRCRVTEERLTWSVTKSARGSSSSSRR